MTNDNIDEIVKRALNASFIEQDGLRGTPVYAAWIAYQLTKLAVALGDDVTPERVAYTAVVLMRFEPLHLECALERAWCECKAFPKPAEIVDFLKEIPGFTMPEQ
jgi:hypothetical protein